MIDRRKEEKNLLFYKLSALTIGLSFVAILLSSIWTYYSVIQIYKKSRLNNVEQLGRGAALAIGDKLLARDYAELESVLKRLFLNTDINIAVVTDSDGKRILSLKRDKKGEANLFFDLTSIAIDKDKDVNTHVNIEDDGKTKVWQKINPGVPIGWLYLELSNTTEELILAKLKTNILLVTTPIFLILVVISLFINRNLKKNIDQKESLMNEEKNYWNSRAQEDPLTKLPNRLLLNDYVKAALEQANMMRSQVGIVFFDLDGFKEVNDQHGHATGDQLLIQISRRLVENLRPMDRVIRYGGDEFIIIFNNIHSREELESLIERLSAEINLPFEINGHMLNTRASIGVTLYPLDGTDHIDELISHADEAMYVAKTLGKNQVYWYC